MSMAAQHTNEYILSFGSNFQLSIRPPMKGETLFELYMIGNINNI